MYAKDYFAQWEGHQNYIIFLKNYHPEQVGHFGHKGFFKSLHNDINGFSEKILV